MANPGRKEIEITVGLDGTTTVEAVGFQGKGCKEATRPYEEAIGPIAADRDKPELRMPEVKEDIRIPRRT
jgi:hypothetical protein